MLKNILKIAQNAKKKQKQKFIAKMTTELCFDTQKKMNNNNCQGMNEE